MPPYRQYGGSLNDIQVYRSPYRIQHGRNYYYSTGNGLSSAFKGIFSFLKPLLINSSKKIGREVLEGGLDVLSNTGKDKSFSEVLKEEKNKRIKNLENAAIENLKKLKGSNIRSIKTPKNSVDKLIRGYVRRPDTSAPKSKKTSKKTTKKATSSKKKKKRVQRVKDIFD